MSLKISPENTDGSLLSDDEFGVRKRALLIEKEKLAKQITQQDPKNIEWAEIGKDSFDFGLLARKRFEKKESEAKRIIFKTVGSNPILQYQKLLFQLRYLFFKYKEGIKKTKEEINRLELTISMSDQSNLI